MGGIEIIYEKITKDATEKDDYIDNAYLLIENFRTDIQDLSLDENILQLIG